MRREEEVGVGGWSGRARGKGVIWRRGLLGGAEREVTEQRIQHAQ